MYERRKEEDSGFPESPGQPDSATRARTGYRRACASLWLCAGAVLLSMAIASPADPTVSQLVATDHAILDESGLPLRGTDPQSEEFGVDRVEGDLIQILQATDGSRYPPAKDGSPDPRNVVLYSCRAGEGISPTLGMSGLFSGAITPRPGGNTRIFVRVFNAPSLADASFYEDSSLFKVLSWKNDTFLVDIAATTRPLDPNDADGDGLSNSWEKALGSDSTTADTDGDGSSDQEERLAGSNLLDPESHLRITTVGLAGGPVLKFRWQSVRGKSYRIERLEPLPDGGLSVWAEETVGATGTWSECEVPVPNSREAGCYRVCLSP
jgi:hypothetical protein